MLEFERVADYILRLKVPFANIYTAVFLIETEEGNILVDASTTAADAKEIVLPALLKVASPESVKYIFSTHLHGDHAGGIRHLLPVLTNAKILAASPRAIELYGDKRVEIAEDNGCYFGIRVIFAKGHSEDSVAFYDQRTKTLLTGDALQLYGVARYGCGVAYPNDYIDTLEKLSKIDTELLVTSHDYYPKGAEAVGKAQVAEFFRISEKAYLEVAEFVKENASLTDPVKIALAFNEKYDKVYKDLPKLQSYTVKALLNK